MSLTGKTQTPVWTMYVSISKVNRFPPVVTRSESTLKFVMPRKSMYSTNKICEYWYTL